MVGISSTSVKEGRCRSACQSQSLTSRICAANGGICPTPADGTALLLVARVALLADARENAVDTKVLRTIIVFMKNITLSADEAMIGQARATARAQKTTLNQLFRNWLSELAGRQERDQRLAALMDRLDYVKSGGPFSREESNER